MYTLIQLVRTTLSPFTPHHSNSQYYANPTDLLKILCVVILRNEKCFAIILTS